MAGTPDLREENETRGFTKALGVEEFFFIPTYLSVNQSFMHNDGSSTSRPYVHDTFRLGLADGEAFSWEREKRGTRGRRVN